MNVHATIHRIALVASNLLTYEGYFFRLGVATIMVERMPKCIKMEIVFNDSDLDPVTISIIHVETQTIRFNQTMLALQRYITPELEKDNRNYESKARPEED